MTKKHLLLVALISAFTFLQGCSNDLLDELKRINTSDFRWGRPCDPCDAGSETPDPDPDLVAWWSFDNDIESVAVDQTDNANNGSVINAQYSDRSTGKALMVTGYNSGVDIPDNPCFHLTGSLTIEAIIRPDDTRTTHGLIFFRGDSRPGLDPYTLTLYPDTTLHFFIAAEDNAYSFVTVKLDLGTTYHVSAVFDAETGTQSLYLDGVLVDQALTDIRPFSSLDERYLPGVSIGHHARRSSNDYGFTGMIDEVKLYSRALSLSEIEDHSH